MRRRPTVPLAFTIRTLRAYHHCLGRNRSLRENRMFASTHRILAISLALSGRVEESRDAARNLLELEPTLTVSRFEQRYPGSGTPQAKLFGEALAMAGVPP